MKTTKETEWKEGCSVNIFMDLNENWWNTIVSITFSDQWWLAHFRMERRTLLLIWGTAIAPPVKKTFRHYKVTKKRGKLILFFTLAAFHLLFVCDDGTRTPAGSDLTSNTHKAINKLYSGCFFPLCARTFAYMREVSGVDKS